MVTNVLFAGVGGQGVVTASDLLAAAAFETGWSVKKAETHGMAQRGGSVLSQVRFAADEEVRSPILLDGDAHYLIGMELLEGVRALPMLRPDGLVVCDRREFPPITVLTGGQTYPADVAERLAARGVVLDATLEAERLGEARAAGSLLLGFLSARLRLPETAWRAAFETTLRAKALGVNWAAFLLGRTKGAEPAQGE